MFHNCFATIMMESNNKEFHDEMETNPLLNESVSNNGDAAELDAIIREHHFHCQEQLKVVRRHAVIPLNRDVHINTQDVKGQTALMRATSDGNIWVMKLLINANANKELKNVWGMTALMLAVQSKNLESVQVLIDAGVDLSATNTLGATASMIAEDTHQNLIFKLLKAAKDTSPKKTVDATPVTHANVSLKRVLSCSSSIFFSGTELTISSDEEKYYTTFDCEYNG